MYIVHIQLKPQKKRKCLDLKTHCLECLKCLHFENRSNNSFKVIFLQWTKWPTCTYFAMYFLKKYFLSVYILNVITFLFLVSPSQVPSPCLYECAPQLPTHFCLTSLAHPFSWASCLHRTKGLPSHLFQISPSSATYVAGALDQPMYTLWLVV